jgi:membrane protease YdiL (CAAX protease family)
MRQAGMSPFTASGALSLPYVFLLTLIDSCVLVIMIVALLAVRGERPLRVLFGRSPRGRDVVLGVLLVPTVFIIAFGVLLTVRWLAPWLHNLEKNPLEALIGTRADALMFLMIAVVGGGIREEMQRGFILHRFDQHLGGGWVGLIVYSLAFGAGHLLQGWDAALTVAVLGALWGVVYLRRRTILPAMISHSTFNAAQILRYTLSV